MEVSYELTKKKNSFFEISVLVLGKPCLQPGGSRLASTASLKVEESSSASPAIGVRGIATNPTNISIQRNAKAKAKVTHRYAQIR